MPAEQPNPRIFQELDRTSKRPYAFHEYASRVAWTLVHCLFIRPSPRNFHGWRRFWAVRFGAKIDPSSRFASSTVIFHPWLLTIGRHCHLSEGVTVYNLGPISIGDHTFISPDVYLCAGTHDYTEPHLPLKRPPINIGSGVRICTGAFIGPGVSIGDNSTIGPEAVVMRDVCSGAIAIGNPARIIKSPDL